MKTPYDLFGVEHGPGWRKITEPLMEYCIERGIDIFQIKEKFGGLRFYVGSVPEAFTEEWDAKLEAAEREAAITCERCGAPGTLRNGGWMQTLCDEHAKP